METYICVCCVLFLKPWSGYDDVLLPIRESGDTTGKKLMKRPARLLYTSCVGGLKNTYDCVVPLA